MQFQDEVEDEFWCAALNSALRRGCRTSTAEAVHIADSALEAHRARQPQEAGPEPKYGLPHPPPVSAKGLDLARGFVPICHLDLLNADELDCLRFHRWYIGETHTYGLALISPDYED